MKTAALIGVAALLIAGSASAGQTDKTPCERYLETGAQPRDAKCDLSRERRSGLDISNSGPVYVYRVLPDGRPRFLEDRTATAKSDDSDKTDSKPN